MKHDLRRAVLTVLSGGRELPLAVISQEVEVDEQPSLSVLGYHVNVLTDVGLVRRIGGSLSQPVYRLADSTYGAGRDL